MSAEQQCELSHGLSLARSTDSELGMRPVHKLINKRLQIASSDFFFFFLINYSGKTCDFLSGS